jgi:hypothetical protein
MWRQVLQGDLPAGTPPKGDPLASTPLPEVAAHHLPRARRIHPPWRTIYPEPNGDQIRVT